MSAFTVHCFRSWPWAWRRPRATPPNPRRTGPAPAQYVATLDRARSRDYVPGCRLSALGSSFTVFQPGLNGRPDLVRRVPKAGRCDGVR